MNNETGFLVVGGDSLVGGGLANTLQQRGYLTFASTRQKDTLASQRIYLDFDSIADCQLPMEVNYAFLIAATTNYKRCETDPLAWKTNVESIPQFAAMLLEQGVFVTFISTNAVFGGEQPWPEVDAPHAPGIAYARQKSEGEKAILAAAHRLNAMDRLNIVRLTKILAADTPPLPTWYSTWERGEIVCPFGDLIFAPMSVKFVSNALATIGEKRIPGILHLSGKENVSYVDLAHCIAERVGISSQLIKPTTADEKGVHILFKPRFSGIGMQWTTELTGIAPQTLTNVVCDITENYTK